MEKIKTYLESAYSSSTERQCHGVPAALAGPSQGATTEPISSLNKQSPRSSRGQLDPAGTTERIYGTLPPRPDWSAGDKPGETPPSRPGTPLRQPGTGRAGRAAASTQGRRFPPRLRPASLGAAPGPGGSAAARPRSRGRSDRAGPPEGSRREEGQGSPRAGGVSAAPPAPRPAALTVAALVLAEAVLAAQQVEGRVEVHVDLVHPVADGLQRHPPVGGLRRLRAPRRPRAQPGAGHQQQQQQGAGHAERRPAGRPLSPRRLPAPAASRRPGPARRRRRHRPHGRRLRPLGGEGPSAAAPPPAPPPPS